MEMFWPLHLSAIHGGLTRVCFDKMRDWAREFHGCQGTVVECVDLQRRLSPAVNAAMIYLFQRSHLRIIGKYRLYKLKGGVFQPNFFFDSARDEEVRKSIFDSFLRELE